MKNYISKKSLTLVAAGIVSALAFEASLVTAQDSRSMPKDPAMMKENMAMMHKMMGDPAMMPSADDMAKAKAMQEMATMMSSDPECKKMCMEMMAKPDMKMTMAPTDDAVKAAKDAMMKDPAAMKMVMAHAMTMTAMSMNKPAETGTHGMPPTNTGGMAPR